MRALRWAATAALAVALIVNAVIHFRLATPFDAVAGTLVTQGDLFRIQAIANLAVIPLVAIVRRRWADTLALVFAAGGAALIVVTALVPLDLSAIGMPVLFEPAYYPDKTTALIAQLFAVAAAGALLVLRRRPASTGNRSRSGETGTADAGS
ncbi:hypothetical protein GCM10009792_22860 [Microcella alkalica]|uniref:Uncharacterized protein n=1 Tax=Microcella alkalica TaxID=355930 RepID=A0A839EFV6_9MICO|nr:hypothetical protein [Microcella alkalica]MBA8848205.1 hypothetical protein [Microcella alkalica]